jgi:hypothetical protein
MLPAIGFRGRASIAGLDCEIVPLMTPQHRNPFREPQKD